MGFENGYMEYRLETREVGRKAEHVARLINGKGPRWSCLSDRRNVLMCK